ncbi:methionyl-tRNA formyltransferase [Leeia aquatica]|uniref:Methionyl-tRNA formyltransferase n=1 Tax=Leeia aquatica TaxID=2725557 RepID=A0A847S999_9NEIS|nr:methionyl-tRNA formyltransferase [Leeia aquatica]NLR76574.1 methionyl-tRNA formyltransferase [Leeia aquatica]
MRVIFAGTPVFAERALQALVTAGFDIPVVLTQPDRPAGRGMKLTPSPVKQCALAHGLPVWQPTTLRDAEVQHALRELQADVMVVAAYGLILPQGVLDIPRYGCLNIHASLLPRWRGAAPIHRAIEAGDAETGITIMQMEAGLDTGPMLSVHRCAILPEDTTGSLHDRLAEMGAQAIVADLPRWVAGQLAAVPQPAEGVNYASKIDKTEAELLWQRPASELARRIRAFHPAPGCWTRHQGEVLKVWAATEAGALNLPAGQLHRDEAGHLMVACGEGSLRLLEVQRAGGKRQPAAQWVQGLADGVTLGL